MNLTYNTIKMKHRLLKQGLFALAFAVGSTAMAQTTDATDANLEKGTDEAKYVKLVDNKGTIKYLRSNNGITTITSTSAGSKTTTTWQLGGTLTDDTYIDLSGKEFGFKQVSDGTDANIRKFLVLENDNLKQVALNDLVTGIYHAEPPQATDSTGNIDITVTGIPAITDASDANAFKLSVYRNGIKLRITEDFDVTQDKVTIKITPIYAGDEFEIHYIN
jgi:hypothetical protein